MQFRLSDIDFYQINGLWHWEYEEFCSEDGFAMKEEAVEDAKAFLSRI